jgi:pyruvate dehydrogenase E2 component (dihydrolipoamide acetyltransferase)
MKSGNLTKWHKKEGDEVSSGDLIAEIETDKATMEVEAADDGVIAKILVQEGSKNIPVHSLIALLSVEGEDSASLNLAPEEPEQETESDQPKTTHSHMDDNTRIIASPLAKRIAKNEGIDLSSLKASGPQGRIIKQDVLSKIPNKSQTQPDRLSAPTPIVQVFEAESNHEEIPNTNLRRIVAERLSYSKQNIPHFYLSIECNIDKLLAVREELNASDHVNTKISVNDLIVSAVAKSLKEVQEVNASWNEDSIIYYKDVHVSVAVAIDGGLITPIVKFADRKRIEEISREIKSLGEKAKAGKLSPEEFQGGGFTVSNLGMYGIKQFQAIINPPQSCILAIGAGVKRPVVINHQIKISTIMDVSLSCDHRVVDGVVGAKFLSKFKNFIENPLYIIM